MTAERPPLLLEERARPTLRSSLEKAYVTLAVTANSGVVGGGLYVVYRSFETGNVLLGVVGFGATVAGGSVLEDMYLYYSQKRLEDGGREE